MQRATVDRLCCTGRRPPSGGSCTCCSPTTYFVAGGQASGETKVTSSLLLAFALLLPLHLLHLEDLSLYDALPEGLHDFGRMVLARPVGLQLQAPRVGDAFLVGDAVLLSIHLFEVLPELLQLLRLLLLQLLVLVERVRHVFDLGIAH